MAANAVQRALAASRAFRGTPVNAPLGLGYPYQGTHTLGNWESDRAVDVSTPIGTPVYAVGAGTIGSQFGALDSGNPRMAGLRLHLNTPADQYYYAHLSRFAPGIEPGARVTPGEILGYSGEAAGVPHLHFAEESGLPQHLWSSATMPDSGTSQSQTAAPSAGNPLAATLQQAGFKGDALRTAYAIAERESGGRPTAFNPNASTGDLSYGLFQINMLGGMGPARRQQFGIASNKALFDPNTNARAAFQLSKGGTDFGAWGVGPNAYRHVPLDTSVVPTSLSAPPPAALAQVDTGPPAAALPGRAPAAPQPNVAERIRSGIVSALLAHGGQMNPQTLLNVALNARRAR